MKEPIEVNVTIAELTTLSEALRDFLSLLSSATAKALPLGYCRALSEDALKQQRAIAKELPALARTMTKAMKRVRPDHEHFPLQFRLHVLQMLTFSTKSPVHTLRFPPYVILKFREECQQFMTAVAELQKPPPAPPPPHVVVFTETVTPPQ